MGNITNHFKARIYNNTNIFPFSCDVNVSLHSSIDVIFTDPNIHFDPTIITSVISLLKLALLVAIHDEIAEIQSLRESINVTTCFKSVHLYNCVYLHKDDTT